MKFEKSAPHKWWSGRAYSFSRLPKTIAIEIIFVNIHNQRTSRDCLKRERHVFVYSTEISNYTHKKFIRPVRLMMSQDENKIIKINFQSEEILRSNRSPPVLTLNSQIVHVSKIYTNIIGCNNRN